MQNLFTTEKGLKNILLLQASVGILISLVLVYYKYSTDPLTCGIGNCQAVQNSEYGDIMGVPVAILGILYYFILIIIDKNLSNKAVKIWLLWGISFSLYLTYVEIFILKEICDWCVLSFINIIVLYVIYHLGSRRIRTKTTFGSLPETK